MLTDTEFRLKLYNDLEPNKPLETHSKLYVPIYKAYQDDTAGYIEPILSLQTRIEFNKPVGESIHYFSGFRGSGKSTELKQLIGLLKDAGYVVLYSDANEFLNVNAPVEITDLLYTLAVAFSKHLGENEPTLEAMWKRLVDYLKRTNIEFTEVSFDLEAVNITAELKASDSFRTRFRQAFENHVSQLDREIRSYFQETAKKIREQNQQKPIVFIFDNLEKIVGTGENAEAVQKSVERVFQNHNERLRLPNVHMVYTVPPWLRFLRPLEADTVTLSGIRLWKNDEKRSELEEGIERLREVLRKRLVLHDKNGWTRFFGVNSDKAADQMIRQSGGHIRDLFRMMREAIVRSNTLPISATLLERATQEVHNAYLPIRSSHANILYEIAKHRNINPETQNLETISLLLDTHMALYFQNGKPWYDVLPVLLPEIKRVLQIEAEESGKNRQP
jgi:energy-coupling factor transporter ATP-binding protein EcfA2